MNRKNKIAVFSFITVTLLFILTNVTGCFSSAEEKEKAEIKTKDTTDHEKNHSCCDEIKSEEISEASVYQLESNWIDQDEKAFSLDKLKDKKVVLTMFFASCTYTCPILVNDMKRIETAIAEEENLSDYSFVLVSIDPERDTPATLKKLALKNSIDLKRWKLLSGSSDDIMELAAVIGFKYKKDKTGEYSHSNLITFLNDKGEIVHQQVGLNQDISPAIEKITSTN